MKRISNFFYMLVLLCVFTTACNYQSKQTADSPMVIIFSPEKVVAEKSSFNKGNDDEDMIRVSYKDSAFYTAISRVSIFKDRVKTDIAEYVLSHLKGVKTLRLLQVTHYYQILEKRSSYFITYYKNRNTDRKWGCRLNFSNGKYRLHYQNINPAKEKVFQRMILLKPEPDDLINL